MLPHAPGVQMQRKPARHKFSAAELELESSLAIPDDAMDVDRVLDEDKDSDPDKVRTMRKKNESSEG